MSPFGREHQAPILRRLLLARTGGRPPRTIAVVGNAPLRPSAERARLIDGAALVVRMTTFAVDRDVPAIGARTDVVVLHRAVKPGPDTFRDHPDRLYLLAEPGRGFWEPATRPPWWPGDLELVPVSNREFTARTRRALRFGRLDVAWPTTGTLTVHLMHRLFPHARIHLAGSTLPAGGSVRSGRAERAADGAGAALLDHHWGAPVQVTPEHRLAREGATLRRWQREGWLRVLT